MRSSMSSRPGPFATRTWCSTGARDGEVAALEDACWHRLLPLSMGHLEGDEVVCGYHGLVFNAAGRCTYMPAQKTINPSACVRAFPVCRAASPRLDLARRSCPRGSGEDPRFPLERRHRMGRRGRHLLQPEMRLPARHRQPHGPDPRDLCPCGQHRRRGDHQHPLRRHPHGPHGDGDALDDQHRAAAVLGQAARQARRHVDRWQIIYFQAPVHGRRRCGRGRHRNRRSAGRSLARRERRLPGRHHAGDRQDLPLLLELRRTFRTDDEQLTRDIQRGACQRGQGRLRPGPRGARGAAEGHRQEPAAALLQPQHRCRRPLGPQADRRDAGERARAAGSSPCRARRPSRSGHG